MTKSPTSTPSSNNAPNLNESEIPAESEILQTRSKCADSFSVDYKKINREPMLIYSINHIMEELDRAGESVDNRECLRDAIEYFLIRDNTILPIDQLSKNGARMLYTLIKKIISQLETMDADLAGQVKCNVKKFQDDFVSVYGE